MSTERLELSINLINGVSTKAGQIKKDLGQITAQAKKLQDQLGLKGLDTKFVNSYMKGLLRDVKLANGELKQPKKEQWLSTGVAFGELIKDAMESAAKMLINGAKEVLKLVGDAEQTEIGLKYQAPQAREYIKLDVGAYSKITGTGQEDIKKQLLPLLQENFTPEQARQVREASSDLSVMLGEGTGAIDEFLDTFRRINQKEALQSRQLMRMRITEEQFYGALGKNLNISSDLAKKLAGKGKINKQDLINTILQIIASKEEGKTGVATKEYSESFFGRVEKLKALPQEFLAAMKDNPAWKQVNIELGNLYDNLSPNSPHGKAIMTALGNAFTKLSQLILRALTPENIDKWVGRLEYAIGILGFIFDHLEGIYTMFQLIGTVVAGLKIIGAVTAIAEALPAVALALGTVTAYAGTFFTAIATGAAAVAAPLGAVVFLLGSVLFAYSQIKSTIDELGGWDAVKNDIKDWWGGKGPAGANQNKINEYSPPEKIRKALASPKDYTYFGSSVENLSPQTKAKFENLALAAPNMVPNNTSSKSVTISAPINVTVEGQSDDANYTGQVVGQSVSDHFTRSVNQSLNELGTN